VEEAMYARILHRAGARIVTGNGTVITRGKAKARAVGARETEAEQELEQNKMSNRI
jgi:hypothetical protein